jgi:hypothetical protein
MFALDFVANPNLPSLVWHFTVLGCFGLIFVSIVAKSKSRNFTLKFILEVAN